MVGIVRCGGNCKVWWGLKRGWRFLTVVKSIRGLKENEMKT